MPAWGQQFHAECRDDSHDVPLRGGFALDRRHDRTSRRTGGYLLVSGRTRGSPQFLELFVRQKNATTIAFEGLANLRVGNVDRLFADDIGPPRILGRPCLRDRLGRN